MKCIDTTKKYLNENKNGIICLLLLAGASCVGTICGILYEVHTMGINRDGDPAFNKMLEQAAYDGVVTGDKGITRKVVGVLIYGGERVNKD